jgi:hypothetical protein
MFRKLLIFSLFIAAISSGIWGALSPSAQAKGPTLLPIFFYWDYESPRMDEADMAKGWNFAWNWPGSLSGQKMKNCSDLERVLAGKPYNYEVARDIRGADYCPMVTMVGRIAQPRRALFNSDKPDREIYQHLDMSSLHWGDLDTQLGRKGAYTLAQLSLKGVDLNKNQIAFNVGKRNYEIDIYFLADFEGDGGQQIYCALRYYDNKIKDDVEYPMLLTREKKGGPIIAKPIYVKKPASFKLPKEILDNMVSLDPRYDEQ